LEWSLTPPETITIISEPVFTANHLTDTDKQNRKIHKPNTTQKANTAQNRANKTTWFSHIL